MNKEKKTKRVAGEDLPASAFAYVGDPDDTGTWKLPIRFSSEEKTKSHIRNALSRFDQTDLPAEAKAKVKAKIMAAARRHGIEASDDSEKKSSTVADLRKDLFCVGVCARILQDIRCLRGYYLYEADQEGDPEDLGIVDSLTSWLTTGIQLLKDIVEEETDELAAINKAGKGEEKMETNDLSKAVVKGHFAKAAAHHEKMADHHKALSDEHAAHMETHKAMVDHLHDMENKDDHHKALHSFHKASVAHHKAHSMHHDRLHKAHTALADHFSKCDGADVSDASSRGASGGQKAEGAGDAAKAAAVVAQPAAVVAADPSKPAAALASPDVKAEMEKMLNSTFIDLVKSTLSGMASSADVKAMVEEALKGQIATALGNKLVPTDVKAAGTLIGRDGKTLNGPGTFDQDAIGL